MRTFSQAFWATLAIALLPRANASYYTTLPQGVRAIVYRHVSTTKVSSAFNGTRQESDYSFKININAASIQAATTALDAYLTPLKKLSPEAYDQFQLGEFAIDANGQVSVQALGFAYGFSDRLSMYLAVPYYNAKVEMNFVRTRGNNNQNVQSIVNNTLRTQADRDLAASWVSGATNSLPDISGGNIQSIVVNHLGYQPLGNWQAKGLGDTEIGTIYRWTNQADWGLASTFGMMIPTGRQDDPDIIQDIAFGDGQWDVFAEFGGGFSQHRYNLAWDGLIRYTYQAPKTKNLRIPESQNYVLGSTKANFQEKLGDKIDVTIGPTYFFTPWLSLSTAYLFNRTFKASYDSSNSNANKILEANTSTCLSKCSFLFLYFV